MADSNAPQSVHKFNADVAKMIKNLDDKDIVELLSSRESIINPSAHVNHNNNNKE
jgi:hypothetical protein